MDNLSHPNEDLISRKQKDMAKLFEKLAEKWNLGDFGPFGPKFRAFRAIQANRA